jgi:hypothetical protein
MKSKLKYQNNTNFIEGQYFIHSTEPDVFDKTDIIYANVANTHLMVSVSVYDDRTILIKITDDIHKEGKPTGEYYLDVLVLEKESCNNCQYYKPGLSNSIYHESIADLKECAECNPMILSKHKRA